MARKLIRLVLGALAALAGTTAALADTVVYIGGQCGTTTPHVTPVQYTGTGCPATGSWDAGVLAVGTDGVLCYSTVAGSPGTWVDVGGGSGVADLDDLSDVTITSGSTGEVLRHNGSAWVDAQLAYGDLSGTPTVPEDLADLGDVSIAAPADGEVLRYAGGGWYNNRPYIADLADLVGVTPGDGEVLAWDSGDEVWAPIAVGGGGQTNWTAAAVGTAQTLSASFATITGTSRSVTPAAAGDYLEISTMIRVIDRPTAEDLFIRFFVAGQQVFQRSWTPPVGDVFAFDMVLRITEVDEVSGRIVGRVDGSYNEGVTSWDYPFTVTAIDTSASIAFRLEASQNAGSDMQILLEGFRWRVYTPEAP